MKKSIIDIKSAKGFIKNVYYNIIIIFFLSH